jgi:hypothetical protein
MASSDASRPSSADEHRKLEKPIDNTPESVDSSRDEEKFERDQPVEAAADAEAEVEPAKPAAPPGPPGGPPPNGGLQAWVQVAGSWVLFFNTWGLLNTFGKWRT